MAMKDDDFAFPAMLTMVQALSEEIEAAEVPLPEFIGIVPGDALIPDYCCGGMAWVRLVNMSEWVTSDDVSDRFSKCVDGVVATIEVGIMRCAPMGEEINENEFEPPTLAQQLDATRLQMADMALMRKAIVCNFARDDRYKKRVALTQYTPAGPMGQCLGGRWLFDVTSV